ncbi:GAF domain-containing protein [Actinoplanes xinjiangensis]|uniref:GAF domain-containing protein n=1 Tax=Actinoplanes xinjiangensis TaxID=512350 RepID=UPI00342D0DC2
MARIVVAEDDVDVDVDVADWLAQVLGRAGHTVYPALDGPTALELTEVHHPDLVIVDQQMPGMTGLQVADRLLADPATADTPILMVSAAAPAGAEDVVDLVLAKPFRSRHLVDAAHRLLQMPRRPVDPVTDPRRLLQVAALVDDFSLTDQCEADLFTANVAVLLDADTAAINLLLNDSVLIAAASGLPPLLQETRGAPAGWAPCTSVVRHGNPVLLTDTHTDPNHHHNPLVTRCGIRSYAGVPLRVATGEVVGTLCVLKSQPLAFTNRTTETLTVLAGRAIRYLQRRAN